MFPKERGKGTFSLVGNTARKGEGHIPHCCEGSALPVLLPGSGTALRSSEGGNSPDPALEELQHLISYY